MPLFTPSTLIDWSRTKVPLPSDALLAWVFSPLGRDYRDPEMFGRAEDACREDFVGVFASPSDWARLYVAETRGEDLSDAEARQEADDVSGDGVLFVLAPGCCYVFSLT